MERVGLRRRESFSVAAQIKGFDVYAKVHDEFRIRTQTGGIISLASMLIMAVLFLTQFLEFMHVETIDRIVVDTTLNQKLHIGLNITFPHLRCDEVSVDTVDSTGENQLNIHGGIAKINLGLDGNVVEDTPAGESECLSCMDAQDKDHLCCNSCRDLKNAYIDAGLSYYDILDKAKQCTSVGCEVFGDVMVNKVSGNIHVALGRSAIRNGKHVHEFNIKDISDGFNTSHVINRLQFGQPVPGIASPLEGISKIVQSGAGMFHYYIKLVPTTWKSESGTIYTHQYAATDSSQNVMVRRGKLTGLPGVFFVYEFNPFMVQKVDRNIPLSHFLTTVSAIVGGVYTIAGFVDGLMYHRFRTKKSK